MGRRAVICLVSGTFAAAAPALRAQDQATPPPQTSAIVAAPAPLTPETGFAAGDEILVTLTTGETLKVRLVALGEELACEHPVLGKLTLGKDKFTAVRKSAASEPAAISVAVPQPPAPPPPPPAAPVPPAPPPAPAAAPAAPPPDPSFFDNWTGNIEGGMNGTDGNSNSASFRVNLNGRRETPDMLTTLGLGWWYARANDKEVQDRTTYDARNEWPIKSGSSWKWFVASTGEFDAFKQFEYRLTASTGLSWNFYTSDDLSATMRLGLGGTREFGPDAADPTADAFPGVDVSYKVSEHSKLTASYDGVFNLDETDKHRSVLRMAYDVLLDAKNNLGLKFGIEDRYDATPLLGRERHDLEYFVLLTLRF